jgi:hypothetical protein
MTPTCVSTQDRRFLPGPKPFFALQRSERLNETEEAPPSGKRLTNPSMEARPLVLVTTVTVILNLRELRVRGANRLA